MVSAFLVREGLTLAQEPCDAKSNEITALPRLLDRIHLEEAVVTIDAAGCQTAIVQALREAGADYVLAVKRNQPTLHREVKAVFDEAERGTFAPQAEDRCETVERNGGRRERRTCTVLGGPGLGEWVADPKTWPDLRSLVRVQAERTGPRGRRQRSVRYYISSRSPKAEALLALVRGHWGGVDRGISWTHQAVVPVSQEVPGCWETVFGVGSGGNRLPVRGSEVRARACERNPDRGGRAAGWSGLGG